MASRTEFGEGKDGEREKQRYKENKVYTRKVFKGSKKNKSLGINTAITTIAAANNEDNPSDKNNVGNSNNNSADALARPLPSEFEDSTNQQLAPRIDTAVSVNTDKAPAQPLPFEFGDSANQHLAPRIDTAVSDNTAEAPAQPLPLELGDSANKQPAPRVDTAVSGNSAEAPAQPLHLELGDSANKQPAPRVDTAVSGNSTEATVKPLPLIFGDSANKQPAPCVDTVVSGNSTEAPVLKPLPLDFGDSNYQQPALLVVDTAVSDNSAKAPAQPLSLEVGDSTNQHPASGLGTAVSDDSSSLKKQQVVAEVGAVKPSSEEQGKIGLALKPKQGIQELRRKLESELNLVRNLVKRIEAIEEQKSGFSNPRVPFNDSVDFGLNEVQSEVASVGTFEKPVRQSRPLNQLNISVLGNGQAENGRLEKEKRTPKANQFYRNSEFLLAEDKFPAAEGNKKSKSSGKKLGGGGFTHNFSMGNSFFKSCSSLLERLMKHKHGWVFNTPVDVKGLGLHDYYTIIKHPMDLGTVKSRLNQNWYKSPREFAEDVRLTFSNAMTYNPKGQDVHVMAELLSQMFEDKWAAVEADWFRDMRLGIESEVSLPMPTPRMAHPVRPPPLDMRRILNRQESLVRPGDLRPKLIATTPSSRTPTLKKPKAKDLYKRDMTYEEKQKLSTNLLSLPSEKLDNIVQIIKKSNSALLHHDDEIEVDIDSVDNETLWQLDRFYTNYKKNLSKHKRKAEAEQNLTKRTPAPVLLEVPKEAIPKEQNVSTSPVEMEKEDNNASRSSSSSSSSSDSESSSSDSDSGSSSSFGSDAGAGRSPSGSSNKSRVGANPL